MYNNNNNRKSDIRKKRDNKIFLIELVIDLIMVMAVVLIMGSFIAMIEAWAIIKGSVVAIVICSIYLMIYGAYCHMVSRW